MAFFISHKELVMITWKLLEVIEILIRAYQLRSTKLKPTDNMWEDVANQSPSLFSVLLLKARSKT
jgi:hypothetical protein